MYLNPADNQSWQEKARTRASLHSHIQKETYISSERNPSTPYQQNHNSTLNVQDSF